MIFDLNNSANKNNIDNNNNNQKKLGEDLEITGAFQRRNTASRGNDAHKG